MFSDKLFYHFFILLFEIWKIIHGVKVGKKKPPQTPTKEGL
jgi:hypothetical protein